MVIYNYMKTYNMIFCEINNPFVILYTILIYDKIHKYFFYILSAESNIIMFKYVSNFDWLNILTLRKKTKCI